MSEFKTEIQKPEWLDDALRSGGRTFILAIDGKIPKSIEGYMLVTSCLRVLRAIYGDDLSTLQGLRDRIMQSEQRMAEMEAAVDKAIHG